MSSPTHIHHSGGVNTPAGSVPFTLPQRSPCGHESPLQETEKHDEDNVLPAAAKEKGEANKKTRSVASGCCSKQAGVVPTKKRMKKSTEESPKKEKRQADFCRDEDFMMCCAYIISVSVDSIIGVGQKSETFWTQVLEKYLLLTEQHLSDYGAELSVQNSASLQQHWEKRIAKSMPLWYKFYQQVKSVKCNGWNEDCNTLYRAFHWCSYTVYTITSIQSYSRTMAMYSIQIYW